MKARSPEGLLDDLAEELTARGLGEQIDFYITGRHPDAIPSSEHIGARFADGAYRVWYRDLGSSRTLVETPDFAAAREVMIREAIALGRGRGRTIRRG